MTTSTKNYARAAETARPPRGRRALARVWCAGYRASGYAGELYSGLARDY